MSRCLFRTWRNHCIDCRKVRTYEPPDFSQQRYEYRALSTERKYFVHARTRVLVPREPLLYLYEYNSYLHDVSLPG